MYFPRGGSEEKGFLTAVAGVLLPFVLVSLYGSVPMWKFAVVSVLFLLGWLCLVLDFVVQRSKRGPHTWRKRQ